MAIKIILVSILAFLIAQCLLLHYLIPIFLLLVTVILLILIFYPEIGLFIVILAGNDFFSLVSEDIFRVPGLFRIKDILFLSALLVLLMKLLTKKIVFKRSLFTAPVLLIFALVVLEIALTMSIQHQSFNYTIRMGRRYLFYLLYFPLVYLIDSERQFRRFLYCLFISSIIYSLLMMVQYALGSHNVIFRFASHVEEQQIAGEYVTRAYATGSSLVLLTLYYFIFDFLLLKSITIAKIFIVLITYAGGVYLGFSRANLFGVIIGFLLAFFLLSNRLKMRTLLFILLFWLSLYAGFEVIRFTFNRQIINPIAHSFRQLTSGASDFSHKTGTFGFRLKDSAERLDLIKQNPLSGIGFVHPLSGIIKIRSLTAGITTSDSGLVTLLLDFGVLGVIWLLYLTVVLLRNSINLLFSLQESERTMVLSIVAYYLSRFFSFLTLCEFVNQSGIVVITIALFILNFLRTNQCHNYAHPNK